MTSQHDVQTSSSITIAVDLEYALLVFSMNHHDSIDPNCSIHNHSFEIEMMRDRALLVVIESVVNVYDHQREYFSS